MLRSQNDKEDELLVRDKEPEEPRGVVTTEPGHIRQERAPRTSGASHDRHERLLLGTTHR